MSRLGNKQSNLVLNSVIMFPANGSMFPQLNINRLQFEINNKENLNSIHDMTFIVLLSDSSQISDFFLQKLSV